MSEVFVWRDGLGFVSRETAPPLIPEGKRGNFPTPYAAGDIAEYMSPAGGGLITSRSHRREELKRLNCREVDPSERPKGGDRGYMHEKNAKRWGKKRYRT
jgi:hypothetical protein